MKQSLRLFALAALMLIIKPSWGIDTFSKVSPSGHTLYYFIVYSNGAPQGAVVTYPNYSGGSYWSGHTKPSGNLIIPSTVTYGSSTYNVIQINSWAFYECTGLITVSLPSTVRTIGSNSFMGCTSLTNIYIPTNSSLNFIQARAFYNCTSLAQNISLPEGFETIGSEAFGNTQIIELNLPSTWRMGKQLATVRPFESSNIKNINVSSSNPNYCSYNGIVFSAGRDTIIAWPPAKEISEYMESTFIIDLSNLSGGNLKAIGEYAFSSMRDMDATEIEIPSGIDTICKYAFSKCSFLTDIIIGNDVSGIGDGAFSDCNALRNVVLGSDVQYIGKYAFQSCNNIQDVIIKRSNPPIITSSSYDPFSYSPNAFIHIPCNSITLYRNAPNWSRHSYYTEENVYEINYLEWMYQAKGYIEILQQPTCSNGMILKIKAFPYEGWIFNGWNVLGDGSIYGGSFYNDNPLSISVINDYYVWASFISSNDVTLVDNSESIIRYAQGGFVIDGADGETVRITDVQGHCLYSGKAVSGAVINITNADIIMVTVGNRPAKKLINIKQQRQ